MERAPHGANGPQDGPRGAGRLSYRELRKRVTGSATQYVLRSCLFGKCPFRTCSRGSWQT
eukprot:8065374-Lingulodinium_polyedra.AAC.1